MTSRIPISLLKHEFTDSELVRPFSPVVWTSSGLAVLTSPLHNLKSIQLEVLKLTADLKEDLKQFDTILADSKLIENKVTDQINKKDLVVTIATELQNRVFPVVQSLSSLGVRLALTEADLHRDLVTAEDILGVINSIRSGQLLTGIGKDITVPVINGAYHLDIKSNQGILTSGDEIVSVKYFPDDNRYEISGGVTDAASKVVATKGVSILAEDNKFVTLSINDKVLRGTSGVKVVYANSAFQISPNNGLVYVEPNSGLTIAKTVAGLYVIDLAQEVVDASNRKYMSGHGVKINGRTLSIDSTIVPEFESGSPGVTVTKVGVNPDVWRISFDATKESLPDGVITPMVVKFANPLTSVYDAFTNSYNLAVDRSATSSNPALSANIVERLATLEGSATALTAKSASVAHTSLSPMMRQAYMNPIMKLYNLLLGNYDVSNVMWPTVTAVEKAMIGVFGLRPQLMESYVDVTPFIKTTEHGPKISFETDVEVDLYKVAEYKLQKVLSSPTFQIPEAFKGTRISIVAVGLNTTKASTISRSQYPAVSYNNEFNLRLLSLWVDSTYFSDNFGFTRCVRATPETWYSEKFKTKPLSVTGGDADFIVGRLRAGQTNSTPLSFPSDLVEGVKMHLMSVQETKDASSIVYDIMVGDEYTGLNYAAKFRRATGSFVPSDTDYIEELEGQTNPGHVRAFSRLYANWKLPDADLNRLVFLLGANNACLAIAVSTIIYRGAVQGELWDVDTIRNEVNETTVQPLLNNSDVDLIAGKATFRLNLSGGEEHVVGFHADSVLCKVQIRVDFRVHMNPGTVFSEKSLFDNSCWALNGLAPSETAFTHCDLVKPSAVPFTPNPDLQFGKLDTLR